LQRLKRSKPKVQKIVQKLVNGGKYFPKHERDELIQSRLFYPSKYNKSVMANYTQEEYDRDFAALPQDIQDGLLYDYLTDDEFYVDDAFFDDIYNDTLFN
jgi:hypothetical protein